jgi:hypothetical protein
MRLSTKKLGRSSLILASLVLAAAITLPSTAFAAPAGTTVGPLPTLARTGGKDPTINFTVNIGGYTGSGTLQATNMGSGVFQATGGTLTMSAGTGIVAGTYCLVPVLPGWTSGTLSTSSLGAFIYDDLVTPALNPSFPTVGGLLFSNTQVDCGPNFKGTYGFDEINIWAGNTGPYTGTAGQYSFYNYDSNSGFTVSYSTPTPVPMPSPDSFTGTVVSTSYVYNGKAFNLFECASSPSKDCATPGSGNPYLTTNSVTAVLQMGAPLTASTVENVLCDANFLSLTLMDGVNTISVNTPCAPGANSVAGATAWVSTDSSGNITAWYLDAYLPANATGNSVTEDIHTLKDPSGVIAAPTACNGCYVPDNPNGEDKGSTTTTQGGATIYYGYVLKSPGSFAPPLPPSLGGGATTTTAGNCTAPPGCQNSPIASTVVTVGGNGTVPFPTTDTITEAAYYIRTDPRGPNCGYYGPTGQPKSLDLSTVTVYASADPNAQGMSGAFLGHVMIPWNICIPSGGAYLDVAIDDGAASINGLNAYPNFVPPPDQVTAGNILACPMPPFKANNGWTGNLTASAPRPGSQEEQEPEQVGNNGVGNGNGIGPPVFTAAVQSCDSVGGSGKPARSDTLFNVQFIQPNPLSNLPVSGTATNQQILVNDIQTQYYYLRNGLLPLINFNGSDGKAALASLQACYVRAQSLTSSGNYNCAAYQTYKCDQILMGTRVAAVGPSNSPLHLPDPWGDLHSRHLNLGFLLNAAAGNDTTVSLDVSNFPGSSSCPTK